MPTNDILLSPKLEAFRRKFLRLTDVRGPTECWPWLGSIDPSTGYGKVMLDLQVHRTHRVSWVLTNGPIPDVETLRPLCVCHSCDNRVCVNPAHLWLGTDGDNSADMALKRRAPHGAKHYSTSLTASDVAHIRADARPVRLIAADYGVSKATIYGVQDGSTWKYLDVPVFNGTRVLLRDLLPKKPYVRKAYVPKGTPRGRPPMTLDPEIIADIRSSSLKYADRAKAHGMSVTTAWKIAKGFLGGPLK